MPLFPDVQPEFLTQLDPLPLSYGRSPMFDFDAGEFMIDANGAVIDRNDETTLPQTVRMILLTERNLHQIYTADYGSDFHIGRKSALPPPLYRTRIPGLIREALMADNRITSIHNFSMVQTGDNLILNFAIADAVKGQSVDIQTLEIELP